MKFGIFYEHQLPRPWDDDNEHRLLKDALDQIELADRVGIDYVWEVEHHFLEEYSATRPRPRCSSPPRRSARAASAWVTASCSCRSTSTTRHASPSASPRSTS